MATTFTRTRTQGTDPSIEQPSLEIQRELARHLFDDLKPGPSMFASLNGTSQVGPVQVTTVFRPSDAPEATHVLVIGDPEADPRASAFVVEARGERFQILKANPLTNADIGISREEWYPDIELLRLALSTFKETWRADP